MIEEILYRENVESDDSKDLMKLACVTDLRKVIHVGNAPYEFHQPENGYKVPDFFYHRNAEPDTELSKLQSVLEVVLAEVRCALVTTGHHLCARQGR